MNNTYTIDTDIYFSYEGPSLAAPFDWPVSSLARLTENGNCDKPMKSEGYYLWKASLTRTSGGGGGGGDLWSKTKQIPFSLGMTIRRNNFDIISSPILYMS
jgi:hypothetical protein